MTSSTPPIPGIPRSYRFPHTVRQTHPSGMRLSVAALARAPLVTVTVVFGAAGASVDQPGREGLAHLTAEMLLEGTTTRDGVALADHFESLGSSLTARADWDATHVSFTVHPERLIAAFDTMIEVVTAPAFPGNQLARLQSEHRAARLQSVADPRELANLAFDWTCHSAASRYRRPVEGTLATHGTLTRTDAAEFWRTHTSPATTTLIIAGDVVESVASQLADRLAGALPSVTSVAVETQALPRTDRSTVTLIAKPDAAQAELRMGFLAVPRNHPDYYKLTVTNAVLGGLFSSRINLNLRERHGYTYGAFSSFDWRRAASPWVVSTAVKSEVSGAAIAETLQEVRGLRADVISDSELELAANYLVGVFPLRFETTAAVAGALASQAELGIADTYFDDYRERIAAITPADIITCANTHFDAERMQIVVAGEPKLLLDQLTHAGAKDVMTYSVEDVEGAA